jgi:hypothetical protein
MLAPPLLRVRFRCGSEAYPAIACSESDQMAEKPSSRLQFGLLCLETGRPFHAGGEVEISSTTRLHVQTGHALHIAIAAISQASKQRESISITFPELCRGRAIQTVCRELPQAASRHRRRSGSLVTGWQGWRLGWAIFTRTIAGKARLESLTPPKQCHHRCSHPPPALSQHVTGCTREQHCFHTAGSFLIFNRKRRP